MKDLTLDDLLLLVKKVDEWKHQGDIAINDSFRGFVDDINIAVIKKQKGFLVKRPVGVIAAYFKSTCIAHYQGDEALLIYHQIDAKINQEKREETEREYNEGILKAKRLLGEE